MKKNTLKNIFAGVAIFTAGFAVSSAIGFAGEAKKTTFLVDNTQKGELVDGFTAAVMFGDLGDALIASGKEQTVRVTADGQTVGFEFFYPEGSDKLKYNIDTVQPADVKVIESKNVKKYAPGY